MEELPKVLVKHLYENAHYDETGQLITASYMDYTMPRADNFPEFNLGFTCTHATSNPLRC